MTFNFETLSDLELYELIIAAYPDKFDEENDGDDLWDEVMAFVEDELTSIEAISELLGRVVMLTMPIKTALTGGFAHALGSVSIADGQANMLAAVSRRLP